MPKVIDGWGWTVALLIVSSSVSASCKRTEHSNGERPSGAVASVRPESASATLSSAQPNHSTGRNPSVSSASAQGSESKLSNREWAETFQRVMSSGAALEDEPNREGVEMGKPLFQCGYANFAWHATALGYLLDEHGRIWFYDLGETWSPEPAGDGLFRESALRARFKKPVLQTLRVDPERLAAMRKKAELARHGEVTRTQFMNDAGGAGCEAYVWDRVDAYEPVRLAELGDQLIRNSSPEAFELYVWLAGELGMMRSRRAQRK